MKLSPKSDFALLSGIWEGPGGLDILGSLGGTEGTGSLGHIKGTGCTRHTRGTGGSGGTEDARVTECNWDFEYTWGTGGGGGYQVYCGY